VSLRLAMSLDNPAQHAQLTASSMKVTKSPIEFCIALLPASAMFY
jgi:hypothetical protein